MNKCELTLEIIKLSILFFGLIGNTFSLVTVSRKTLWNLSVSRFLLALAISDTCCVLSQFLRSNLIADTHSRHHLVNEFHCWFGQTFHTMSHWLLIFIAVERFVAVVFYTKAKMINTIQHANITISCTIILLAVYSAIWNHFKTIRPGECQPSGGDNRSLADRILTTGFIGIYNIIPHFVLITLNVITAVKFASQTMAGTSKQGNLTMVLMVTMMLFLIFTSPTYAINVTEMVYLQPVSQCIKIGVDILFACNYSLNFFIYLGVWKRFRKHFMEFFKRRNTAGPLATTKPAPQNPRHLMGKNTVAPLVAHNSPSQNIDQIATTSSV